MTAGDGRRTGSPVFVPLHLVLAWQRRLIELHGGAHGVRDRSLVEGALDRPRNLAAYEPDAPIERLAALYGVGLAKSHGFVDGNKRIAFAAMVAFLRANGATLDAAQSEATSAMVAVAAGRMDADALAEWIRPRLLQG